MTRNQLRAKRIFEKYLKGLSTVAVQGDAREESFYHVLKEMLEEVAKALGRTDVHITVLPKPTDAGNPDFRIWNGRDRIIGYIEAKPPAAKLDNVERSDQVERYRSTFPNLILTNFLEFRLYRNYEPVLEVKAGIPKILNEVRATPPVQNPDELWSLLDLFLGFSLPSPPTAESLAVELAKRTRFLRDVILHELKKEGLEVGERQKLVHLSGFMKAFRTYLIATLTEQDFADLFAQTITYGLFAARTRTDDGFTRRSAFDSIPRTIGVLRDLFRFISLEDLPDELAWCVDDITEVLAIADVKGILSRYYREGRGSDPIVHFYETFLAQYDPEERERRGVYYTPEPVVNFIVRSLHHLLKDKFEKRDGLASRGVTLLDPAAGTMTFVAKAAQEAVAEFEKNYGSGGKGNFVKDHILKNFYAFELMMAPYAVGHLKMGFFLEELGHRLGEDERMPFYLTNALEVEESPQAEMPFYRSLAEESHLAGEVKKEIPILVILGNPPYSGHSSNPSEKPVEIKGGTQYIVGWKPRRGGGAEPETRVARRDLGMRKQPTFIGRLIRDYYFVDERPLGEKNPKWLQDDYVKFLRFAQWKIEQAGRGVVGMITNHSYLDNPTFRGMRQSLMRTFDEIYILDLHGNSLKKETCPDGSPDENVFDIRQGVAIAFFVKRDGGSPDEARVYHADLWGTRQTKYAWLDQHDVARTEWRELKPSPPLYLFVAHDVAGSQRYQQFVKVTEIFPLNGVGMTTARDEFVIDFDKRALLNRIRLFKHSKESDDELHTTFKIRRKRGWSIRRAWRMLQELTDSELEHYIVPVLYRPFDVRWIFYHDSLVWRTVKRVMRHMLAGENLALVTMRQVSLNDAYSHMFATDLILDNRAFVSSKGVAQEFPLYLYRMSGEGHDIYAEREPNLDHSVAAGLAGAYGGELSPEQIFHYIYAVLYDLPDQVR